MKRPAATRKKIKKRPASAARTKRWRENALKRKDAEVRQKKNVQTRARRSARKGKPYQTKSPKLQHVAAAAYAAEAAAYAAEGKSEKAMEWAESAYKRASNAHEAAVSAHERADEAKEDAATAYAMAIENNRKVISLEGEVKTRLKSFAETQALTKSTDSKAPSL